MMIRAQNGEHKVVMNIVRDILSIKHFIFSEQIVLMNGFSIGSLYVCLVGFSGVGVFLSSLSQPLGEWCQL